MESNGTVEPLHLIPSESRSFPYLCPFPLPPTKLMLLPPPSFHSKSSLVTSIDPDHKSFDYDLRHLQSPDVSL